MYLGRVVGLGNDRSFGVYAVSGRSEKSKERRLVIKDHFTVATEPLGEPTAEQMEMRDLIFYDAVKVHPDRARVVISNGSQTDPIMLALCNSDKPDYHLAIARGFVETGGAEPDSYRTPRIAGVIDNECRAALGIATKNGVCIEFFDPDTHLCSICNVRYVSTYTGSRDDPREIVIPELRTHVSEFPLEGKTAQKLADNMYDWMDPELVVCTAAALWNPGTNQWDLAVRNLHGDR